MCWPTVHTEEVIGRTSLHPNARSIIPSNYGRHRGSVVSIPYSRLSSRSLKSRYSDTSFSDAVRYDRVLGEYVTRDSYANLPRAITSGYDHGYLNGNGNGQTIVVDNGGSGKKKNKDSSTAVEVTDQKSGIVTTVVNANGKHSLRKKVSFNGKDIKNRLPGRYRDDSSSSSSSSSDSDDSSSDDSRESRRRSRSRNRSRSRIRSASGSRSPYRRAYGGFGGIGAPMIGGPPYLPQPVAGGFIGGPMQPQIMGPQPMIMAGPAPLMPQNVMPGQAGMYAGGRQPMMMGGQPGMMPQMMPGQGYMSHMNDSEDEG